MAVIKDVAKRAGVSIGTVSKFFNHPQTLRPETYQRVAEAVAALDYRPSAIARSMRTGRTDIVAIVVPEISNPFYAQAYSILAAALADISFIPLLITADNNPVFQDMHKLSLLLSHVDAAVLYLLDNQLNKELLTSFREFAIPSIVVSQRPENAPFNIVIQEAEGAYSAAAHLASTGRKRIAFIGGPANDEMTKEKYKGFLSALEDNGLQPVYVHHCPDFSAESAFNAISELPRPSAERSPDALFCANDSLALGSLKRFLAWGCNVPEQVAIVGFDDLPLCRLAQPELSSVSLPLTEIAAHVRTLLPKAVHSKTPSAAGRGSAPANDAADTIFLPTELQIRASSQQRSEEALRHDL